MAGPAAHGDSPRRRAGAAAICFDEQRRVLLIKENYGRRRWSLPGGAIEAGETPEQAVLREAYEETGTRVSIEHLVGEYRLDNGFVVYAFRCTIVAGTPAVPPTGEIAEIVWRHADDLPVPRSNVLHYAVPDAAAGRRNLVRENLARLS